MFRSILSVVLLSQSIFASQEVKKESPQNENQNVIQTDDVRSLETVVVVATRSDRLKSELPYTVYSVNKEEMNLRQQKRSLVENMAEIPGVSIQKTGSGMQSPFLRGFTGNQIVMMVDGVKMNNSTFRSGPNEYWNLISPFFFDQIEVLMGPASTLYGSDAIGGTVYVRSGDLKRGQKGEGVQFTGGKVLFRGATAEESASEYIESSIAVGDKLSLKLGLTNQNFGDMNTGSSFDNEFTGYDNQSFNSRGSYFFDNDHIINFGFDRDQVNDLDRVHKTIYADPWHGITPGGDSRRIYDISRTTAFMNYQVRKGTGFIHQMDLGTSYQFYDRDYRRERTSGEYQKENTTVGTFATNLHLQTLSDFGTWDYGFDFSMDKVNAWSKGYHADGSLKSVNDQGPVADDSYYYTTALYLQNTYQFSRQWEWINGARYTYIKMDAGKVNLDGDNNNGKTQSLNESWDDLSLSSRLIFHAIPTKLSFFTGVSQGFRAPNLSDMTKMGDFGGGTSVPSAGVEPETFTSYEFGVNYTPTWGRMAITTYYTQGDNIISRPQKPTPTGSNAGSSELYGFEFLTDYYLNETITLFGNISYVYGEEETFVDRDTSKGLDEFYMGKIPPLSGQLGIRYEPNDRVWLECFSNMAAKQTHLSPNDKDDNRTPPGGTPGYATINLRGGYNFTKNASISLALENIGDIDYRIHGSGLNEPGRNFILTAQYSF